jgi:hypothetical protein
MELRYRAKKTFKYLERMGEDELSLENSLQSGQPED